MSIPMRRERLYLVRIWLEPSVTQIPQLRGMVTDVKSGSVRYLTKLCEILDFVEATHWEEGTL